MPPKPHDDPRVVIIGGGFGGLYAAKVLGAAGARVTVVDLRNFHLFQPLLYQVATGGLSPGDIASPIRSVLKRGRRVRVLHDEAVDVQPDERRVVLRGPAAGPVTSPPRGPGRGSPVSVPPAATLDYDVLVVASGSRTSYFGHDDWAARAPGLKTVEDALEVRSRVLEAFEHAEVETDAARRKALLTFAIIGGGPTGVELAGAVAELARSTLARDYHAFDPRTAEVLLLEGGDRILPAFPPGLSVRAGRSLERLGVRVWTGAMVTDVGQDGVTVARGGTIEHLGTATVLWAAGVTTSLFGDTVAERFGAQRGRGGRIRVTDRLTLPNHEEVYVIGDLAHASGPDGLPLPGLAPVAMQQGAYVARRILGRVDAPFRYRDQGQLAVIGRNAAVCELGTARFSGFPAWLLWLFVHIGYLIEFDNKVLVMVQWAFAYFTRKRGARLITANRR